VPRFSELAAAPDATLDMLALALAAEFHEVDADGAIAELDALGTELRRTADDTDRTPEAIAGACTRTLGVVHGFLGDRATYDHPDNSMLDRVLTRRRGLPILLSVVYVEVARRAGIRLAPVGLPGHFVVAHFGTASPVVLDPFAGGGRITPEVAPALMRPWTAHEVTMRILNNLVATYDRRGDLGAAIRAAAMRLALPSGIDAHERLATELRAQQARLN